MIILGVILLIVGFLVKIVILWTIGIIVLAVGLVFALLGAVGRGIEAVGTTGEACGSCRGLPRRLRPPSIHDRSSRRDGLGGSSSPSLDRYPGAARYVRADHQ